VELIIQRRMARIALIDSFPKTNMVQ
jgi:hypothetical protein